jgi:glutamine amidotransferase
MIAIIDYGSGNVGAIANIYKQLKIDHKITGDLAELEAAERYILPGVGAFDTTMEYFRSSGMTDLLQDQVMGKGKKVLGICVGMQILADSSEEGVLPGLGWIPGRVRKIDASVLSEAPGLPHMGWNSVAPRPGAKLFDGVNAGQGFYFLHSYYFDASRTEDVAATATYGREIPCAVAHGNVYGMQFHPEKSHANGVTVFRNFAEL